MKWRHRVSRKLRWIGGGAAALLAMIVAADVLLDEPLRRSMEARINEALSGYTVRIRSLDFHVLGFSLDLEDTVITQNAHPDPPVAFIPKLSASVQWRALLSARLVADIVFERPDLHLDLVQLREEIGDPVPVSERGWQDALEAIYPLKINDLRVDDAALVYKDEGDFRPLRMSHVFFVAHNIRNIRLGDRVYPSELHLQGVVFDSGSIEIDGNANFLAKPFPGTQGRLSLARMDMSYFEPIVRRYNLSVQRGTLSARGAFEYAPLMRSLDLENIEVEGAAVSYTHTATTDASERRVASEVSRVAQEVGNAPDLLLRIGSLRLKDGEVAFVNKAVKPGYRIHVSDADLVLKNLSNQARMGVATAALKGRFMGSGALRADAAFRAETQGPNFDLRVKIDDTQVPSMNDVLRTYGKFDVVAGVFSLYSEVKVRDGWMSGYVKPLFRDLNVYDREQDRKKNVFKKIYEGLVGGVSKILENRRRKEVATVATISGPVGDAKTSTMEVIGGLLQNAFFKAILPGFESEAKHSRGSRRKKPRIAEPRTSTESRSQKPDE